MATSQLSGASDIKVENENGELDNQESTAEQNLEETSETTGNPTDQNDGIRVTNRDPEIRVSGTNPQPAVPFMYAEDVRGLITEVLDKYSTENQDPDQQANVDALNVTLINHRIKEVAGIYRDTGIREPFWGEKYQHGLDYLAGRIASKFTISKDEQLLFLALLGMQEYSRKYFEGRNVPSGNYGNETFTQGFNLNQTLEDALTKAKRDEREFFMQYKERLGKPDPRDEQRRKEKEEKREREEARAKEPPLSKQLADALKFLAGKGPGASYQTNGIEAKLRELEETVQTQPNLVTEALTFKQTNTDMLMGDLEIPVCGPNGSLTTEGNKELQGSLRSMKFSGSGSDHYSIQDILEELTCLVGKTGATQDLAYWMLLKCAHGVFRRYVEKNRDYKTPLEDFYPAMIKRFGTVLNNTTLQSMLDKVVSSHPDRPLNEVLDSIHFLTGDVAKSQAGIGEDWRIEGTLLDKMNCTKFLRKWFPINSVDDLEKRFRTTATLGRMEATSLKYMQLYRDMAIDTFGTVVPQLQRELPTYYVNYGNYDQFKQLYGDRIIARRAEARGQPNRRMDKRYPQAGFAINSVRHGPESEFYAEEPENNSSFQNDDHLIAEANYYNSSPPRSEEEAIERSLMEVSNMQANRGWNGREKGRFPAPRPGNPNQGNAGSGPQFPCWENNFGYNKPTPNDAMRGCWKCGNCIKSEPHFNRDCPVSTDDYDMNQAPCRNCSAWHTRKNEDPKKPCMVIRYLQEKGEIPKTG